MNSATRKMTCQITLSLLYFCTLAVVLNSCTRKKSLIASFLLKNGTCAHVSTIVPPFHWRNPNAPRTERHWMKEEIHWPEYDVFNQSYLSLGIPLKIGQHYRQNILDYWINYGSNLSNKYVGFLRDERRCLHSNDSGFVAVEEEDTVGTSSLPKILLIVFGICLILINVCAYCALYNQRRKLRAQELFIRSFYSEAGVANSKLVYVEHISGRHEPENLTANKEMLYNNCEGQYGGDRNGTADDIKRDDSESGHWKISRQCSASTMDTNTKVRRWIQSELNQRSSPELRSLNPTPFEAADQKNIPTRQGTSKIHVPAGDPSQVLVIPVIHQEQNPSCSTTCKQISTTHSVPRKVAKKVSVAVDATPSARIASMLCKHVKDTSGDASIQTAHGALCPEGAVGPECSTRVPAVVSEGEPSNCRHFEYFHYEKNAVSQANPVVTDVKIVSSHSRSVTHDNTSKLEPSDMTNKTVNEAPMEIYPKKIKLRGTKKDFGIDTKPMESVVERKENTNCVTMEDTAANTNEILPVVNSLKNSYRRNESEVLLSERNVVNEHEKQKRCGKGVTLIGMVARRKSSVHLHMLRRPSRLRQSVLTKRKNPDNKSTCVSRRGNPSTVGRPKPNAGTPLAILQDSFAPTSSGAALPTDVTKVPTVGYPSTLVLLHQEPNNTQSSEVNVGEQIVDKQNQLRQELPSSPLSPAKFRVTEAVIEKLPLPTAAFCKRRSPAKVSVGTSTNSLIPSEGKKYGEMCKK